MAQKRMFDREIVSSDEFTEMSADAQNLYFHLGVQADDEGFVTPKGIMRMISAPADSLRLLIAKKFVIPFESGVVVITAWNQNNFLDKNRVKPTKYQKERAKLLLTHDKKYEFNIGLTSIEENSIEESRIEEERVEENRIPFHQFWEIYPKKVERKKSEEKWNKLKEETKSFILEDIPKRLLGRQWREGYIPNPTTYLNGERWNDEIEVEIIKTNSMSL